MNAIRFACETAFADLDWVAFHRLPLPLPFTSVGRSSPLYSHTFLTQSHPIICLRIFFTLKTNQGMYVCVCVCVCVHPAIWIAASSDAQVPDSILFYPVHVVVVVTLSARVLHLGIGGMGIGV